MTEEHPCTLLQGLSEEQYVPLPIAGGTVALYVGREGARLFWGPGV